MHPRKWPDREAGCEPEQLTEEKDASVRYKQLSVLASVSCKRSNLNIRSERTAI